MHLLKSALLSTTSILAAVSASAVDLDLARFATAKQNQLRDYAQTVTNKVPSIVWSFFDAVRVDDWETATNLAARIDRASGRYTNSAAEQSISPALHTLIWPPIHEMIGAYEQFHYWDNKLVHRFGREIIDSIPRGSIYFGGTDPGRFIVTALSESHRDGKPFFTLTQNQLLDGTYLAYLRKMYGRSLYIPTEADYSKEFNDYVADAQQRLKERKLKPGEDVRIVDGRVQVTGPVAVMEINGRLVKLILNKNPNLQVYIEESFALDWMYAYLSPHRLIFELHHKPLPELSPESIQKDETYWRKLTADLVGDWVTEKTSVKELCDFSDKTYLRKDLEGFAGDKGFGKNTEAQKCFSKLRSSIGGLYLWRADHARDATQKNQMQSAAELAFKQGFALCPGLPETLFRYVQLLRDLNRIDEGFEIAKASLRLVPDDSSIQGLVRSLRNEE